MTLPILGNVFIINNLRTEVPAKVDDVEVLDAALRTVGFSVKIHNDCTAQVTVHYRSQWSPQGNVFTPDSHYVHRGVSGIQSPRSGTPPSNPPRTATPPAGTHLGQVHPLAGTPSATPRVCTPPAGTPSDNHTPRPGTAPGRYATHNPQVCTFPAGSPPWQPTPPPARYTPEVCSFSWNLHSFPVNSQKLGSSGATECGVWIGNCNVKVWKSTEHNLHKTWRSLEFCVKSGKRAHPREGTSPGKPPGQLHPRQVHPLTTTPSRPGTPPGRYTSWQLYPSPEQVYPPAGHCSGWYASYWNVFLFSINLQCKGGGSSKISYPDSVLKCSNSLLLSTLFLKQECILVGCVLSACWPYPVVYVSRGRGLHPQEVTSYTPVDRMTDRCKNITMP